MSIWNIFKTRKEEILPYRLTEVGIAENKRLQEQEDKRVDNFIESRAHSIFQAWRSAPIMDGIRCFLLDPSRCVDIYYLYDESTARYKNIDFGKIVREKFRQKQLDYEKRCQ